MNYPKFFDEVQKIEVKDELASFLGAFEDGIMEISYLDVVKNAGHSCPTVAGAYLMALNALKALYADEQIKRGEISIKMKESSNEGVAGVIGSVFTFITGAATELGFKGIGPRFGRANLLQYGCSDVKGVAEFKRLDNWKSVTVSYDPNLIPPDPRMQEAMGKDQKLFGELWQQRVEKILKSDDKDLVRVSD